MKIVKVKTDDGLHDFCHRLTFEHNGEKFTLTPEIDGFRIHKHPINTNTIHLRPCCSNEVVVS